MIPARIDGNGRCSQQALVGGVDVVLVVGVALVLGGLAPFAWAEVALLTAGLGALLLGSYGQRRVRRTLVVAVVALAVGAVRASQATTAHERALAEASSALPSPVRCVGDARIESSPLRQGGAMRWRADLRDAQCDGRPWEGAVTLYGGPEWVARGDLVAVVVDLAPPNRLWNTEDPRPAAARRGDVRSGGIIDLRVVERGAGIPAAIDHLRHRVRDRIDATFVADVAPMARALVLGESDLAPEDDLAIRASGLAHLLAVSGTHLILVVLGSVAAVRALSLRIDRLAARVDVGALAAWLGVPLAWAYCAFAGDAGATRRAAWMLTVGLVARGLGRRSDPARAFGWSLVGMGAADPLVVFDASFVLSAAATAGLLLSSRSTRDFAARAPARLRPLVAAAGASLAASIACAPVVARFAPALPLGGALANLVAVPLGESVALPLCLAHALVAPWGAAERGSAVVASVALRAVRAIARLFAAATFLDVAVPRPTSWQLVALVLGAVAVLLSRSGRRVPPLLATLAVLLVLEGAARREGRPFGLLRATFLDVAQGDSALLDLPNGEAMLVDGGGLVGSPVDTGARALVPTFRQRRRDALALAVLSHPHPDHFLGLPSALGAVSVGALWDSGQGEREGVGGAYAALLASLRARDVPVLRPGAICGAHVIGGARVDVLAPCPDESPDRDPNDNSIVLRVTYGRRAFLLVGDAEREEEAMLLAGDRALLRADVLKVGHHGSRTSSSRPFLDAVGPREAIISCGPRNRFGHPSPSTLDALTTTGARIWRTDHDGAITVTTDGTSLDVTAAAPR